MLEHMARAGVPPNIASFTALIAACARLEDRDRTAHALSLMTVHGLDPDELPPAAVTYLHRAARVTQNNV